MGLRKLSYGHSLMQQIRGHCRDGKAPAIIPLVLAAFIYPPWAFFCENFIYALFLTWSQERRAQRFVILVGSLMTWKEKKKKTLNTREEAEQ